MSHSWFTLLVTRWINFHTKSVCWVASYVSLNSSIVFCEISPHECLILATGSFIEKLLTQRSFGVGRFGYNEQSSCILVDAVHQSYIRVVGVK